MLTVLVLVGFSQGTMLALHIGLRRPTAPAALVGFSGLLAGPSIWRKPPPGTPIMLIHGAADDLHPRGSPSHRRASSLPRPATLVEWHIGEHVGHGIDAAGQHLAGHFINCALRSRQGP
jgi:phospholipase/carboxylesterase